MTSPEDAAALLSEIRETRGGIRLLTQPGGLAELLAVVVAEGLGAFVDPRRLDYSGLRIGVGGAATLLLTVMLVQTIQHRRRLGGNVGLPTYLTAGIVFVGNVLAFQTLHGDAREIVRGALLGGGLLVLAAMYRSAALLLLAGVLAVLVPASLRSWPFLAGFLPISAWIAGVVLVCQKQLREQFTL
jgi:hypothetical protein